MSGEKERLQQPCVTVDWVEDCQYTLRPWFFSGENENLAVILPGFNAKREPFIIVIEKYKKAANTKGFKNFKYANNNENQPRLVFADHFDINAKNKKTIKAKK